MKEKKNEMCEFFLERTFSFFLLSYYERKEEKKVKSFSFLSPLLLEKKKRERGQAEKSSAIFQPEIPLKENYREISFIFLLLFYYERKEERKGRSSALSPLSYERGVREGGGIAEFSFHFLKEEKQKFFLLSYYERKREKKVKEKQAEESACKKYISVPKEEI